MRGAGLALVVLSACTPLVPRPAFTPRPTSALLQVAAPPPPARVEILPPRPDRTAVWMDGEWIWIRARWDWWPGRWVHAPKEALFSPWVFEQGPDGRLWYAPGQWRQPNGAAVDAPPALAIAAVPGGAVVDAAGNAETTGPILRDRPGPPSPNP